MKRRRFLWVAVVILSMVPFPVLAASALSTVKTNVEGVLNVLRNPALQGEKGTQVKRESIEAAASKLFDFVELSKRTLGLDWNKFTPDQRKEFVSLYRRILEDAYVERIIAYTNVKTEFPREVPLSENTVEVQSVVMIPSGNISINYRAIREGNGWKVYDVVVEGVSLISNYRSQFRQILSTGSPDTLLKTLRQKAGKQ